MIAVVLAVTLVLIVGTAWGRFRTQISGDFSVQSKQPTQIYLFGGKDEIGAYTDLPDRWQVTQSGEGRGLSLLITNGVGEKYAKKDVTFHLRLAATDGIGSAENLKIALYMDTAEGEVVAYAANIQAITEHTQLYEQFGDGWVYRFCDAVGEEVEFTLPGGQLSEYSAVLICEEVNLGVDPSMLQLQVIARDN